MTTNDAPELLTTPAICARLGISRWTWRRWVRIGLAPAPAPNVPGLPRWRADDVARFCSHVTRTPGRRAYFGTARNLAVVRKSA